MKRVVAIIFGILLFPVLAAAAMNQDTPPSNTLASSVAPSAQEVSATATNIKLQQ